MSVPTCLHVPFGCMHATAVVLALNCATCTCTCMYVLKEDMTFKGVLLGPLQFN